MQTITERALIQRINRRLAKEGERLCASRPRERANLGNYHTIDVNRNTVEAYHIDDLEAWAREHVPAALAEHEHLVR